MSDEHEATGPRPEPIRFFGTTWVDHDGGYALRRVGAGLGALVAAAAGALVLRFGYEGLTIAKVGNLVNILVAVAFAVCTALAFRRTWEGFSRRPDPAGDASAERSMQSMLLIGFIGSLLAYALRTLTEAPGEKLRRKEYEEAVARYERRRNRPGKRGKRR
ncbi:EamA/RhaT family transporter [Streptomyces olivoreticuli]